MNATDMLTRATLPEDTNSPYSYIYDRLGPFRERFLARAKPPSAFAVVLADTLEAKNPPIFRTVGADARALYATQRHLPARLMPALLRRALAR